MAWYGRVWPHDYFGHPIVKIPTHRVKYVQNSESCLLLFHWAELLPRYFIYIVFISIHEVYSFVKPVEYIIPVSLIYP